MKRLVQKKCFFNLFEKSGIHVLPVNYYSPVPDTMTFKELFWVYKSNLKEVDLNIDTQLDLVDNIFPTFKHEYNKFPVSSREVSMPTEFAIDNGAFAFVDAYVLYCMIRHFLPKRIIEIGSGISTLISSKACSENKLGGVLTELIAIEPYPNDTLKRGFPGLSRLIQEKVENIDFTLFESLNENDILFIDSSHVVRIGGDVIFEFIEVLPRLKKGVIVHFHDIFLPLHYPKEFVMKQRLFFTEQYLLQAFLMYNHAWEVLWAGTFMHLNYPERLKQAFHHYRPDKPGSGSFWMRRKR